MKTFNTAVKDCIFKLTSERPHPSPSRKTIHGEIIKSFNKVHLLTATVLTIMSISSVLVIGFMVLYDIPKSLLMSKALARIEYRTSSDVICGSTLNFLHSSADPFSFFYEIKE
jgi:hypothetical protein